MGAARAIAGMGALCHGRAWVGALCAEVQATEVVTWGGLERMYMPGCTGGGDMRTVRYRRASESSHARICACMYDELVGVECDLI